MITDLIGGFATTLACVAIFFVACWLWSATIGALLAITGLDNDDD